MAVLQLRYAIQTQANTALLQLIGHTLIQGILMETEKKGMISRGCNILLNAIQEPSKLTFRSGWERDVGTIDGEAWNLCLSSTPLVSVSASQKLSH